jgi:hypothetical protein
MVRRYQQLGIALNEVNRSMGLLDVVPEIFVEPVVAKLRVIHDLARAGRAENGALGGTPPVAAGEIPQTPATAPSGPVLNETGVVVGASA